MESKAAKALEIFRSGRNCAQAVYAANHSLAGIDPALAEAVANGFGAGMGRLQRTCGAVTGAIMAIGQAEWDPADPKGSKERGYAKVREFTAAFEGRHGSSECLRLLGVGLSDPDLAKYASGNGMFTKVCEPLVASACEILGEMYP